MTVAQLRWLAHFQYCCETYTERGRLELYTPQTPGYVGVVAIGDDGKPVSAFEMPFFAVIA